MIAALLTALTAIALGTAIGSMRGATDRFTGPAQTFALVSVLTVVCAKLLPDALTVLGLWALLAFAGAFALPAIIERITLRGSADPSPTASAIGLELGYLGLLAHQLGEGFVLGAYSGELHGGYIHRDVLLAVGAHTVPVAALMVLVYRRRSGLSAGLTRAAGLALVTALGIGLAAAAPLEHGGTWEPWLTAAVCGLLMHVVAHGLHEEPLRSDERRLWDMVAVALGCGLVLLAGGSHHEHGAHAAGAEVGHAFVELLLETAPLLLFGLMVGAALQLFGSRIPASWLSGGGATSQAVRGAVVGAPLPVCACGVLPIAQSLRTRGGGAALVVAFLLATPELGVETFALTVRFLGWPFAAVRLVTAVALAIVVALLVASRARANTPPEDDCCDDPFAEQTDESGSPLQRLLAHFDELLYHVGPWTLVGLLAAAYVQVGLDEGALVALAQSGMDIPLVMLIAVPSYVCASSATPFAAVLLAKGLSPGAVLAGLLLGPATNIATLGWLRRSYGGAAAALGIGGLVVACWAMAAGVNAVELPVVPRVHAEAGHEHGLLAQLAVLTLALLVLRGIWRAGLRNWLGSLGESLGAHTHDHGHHHHHHAHGEAAGH